MSRVYLVDVYGKCRYKTILGGGFKGFSFSPRTLGKISNLTNIFQMGWFNHQLVYHTWMLWVLEHR